MYGLKKGRVVLKKNIAEEILIHKGKNEKEIAENIGREYEKCVRRFLEESGLSGKEQAYVTERLTKYFAEGGTIK